jgi:hypothetical protein
MKGGQSDLLVARSPEQHRQIDLVGVKRVIALGVHCDGQFELLVFAHFLFGRFYFDSARAPSRFPAIASRGNQNDLDRCQQFSHKMLLSVFLLVISATSTFIQQNGEAVPHYNRFDLWAE